MFRDELERLGRFLVELGGRAPSAELLARVIERYSRARAALLEQAANLPARAYAEAIAHYHRDGSARIQGSEISNLKSQILNPIALAGGPLPPARFDLFDIVERAGARIALNATECGELSLLPAIAAASGDPVGALARACTARIPAVHHRPNTALYAWLGTRLAARRVRGIVLWSHVGCDLWRAEAQSLREAFGLPVLLLDSGDTQGGSTRSMTRLEAFAETLAIK